MKREIYLPALGIVSGELMMFFGQVNIGLPIHIINLQLISLALIFSNFQSDIKKVLQSMILLILMRIISLVMPQFFTFTFFWYVLINSIIFIPIYIILKNQDISLSEIGINFKRLHIYLPIALVIGIDFAVLEYSILDPSALIENIQISNLVQIAIVMFVFIGLAEELIFRSILQTRLEKVIGLKKGLFLTAILFGIMHSVYGQINEILLATLFGVVIGYIFQKTRSFPFILAINGITNMLLFGILPILLK
ncbi:MAG: CPBP family intramembrane glutamic endopeptidase [Candidatus Methanoperedens sp.]